MQHLLIWKRHDKVQKADLWSVMQEYGIGSRLEGSIEALYKESKACVRVDGELTRVWCETRTKAGMPTIPMAIF